MKIQVFAYRSGELCGTEGDVWGVAIWKLVSARSPNLMKIKYANTRSGPTGAGKLAVNSAPAGRLYEQLVSLLLANLRLLLQVDELSLARAITKKRKRAHQSHTKKADSGGHHVDLELCDH